MHLSPNAQAFRSAVGLIEGPAYGAERVPLRVCGGTAFSDALTDLGAPHPRGGILIGHEAVKRPAAGSSVLLAGLVRPVRRLLVSVASTTTATSTGRSWSRHREDRRTETKTTAIPGTSRSGSDGTRTRDLRRDRPETASRLPRLQAIRW
jgi:hypothetical protein